jgi:hypothetical protein
MKAFRIEFRTDGGCATKDIEAPTAEAALTTARHVATQDADGLCFHNYESALPINEIAVEDEDGNELSVWRDDDLSLRLAAPDLLDAGRLVVARWEKGDLAGAVRALASAIAKAEG